MANEKITVVGTNIQEKASVIWNVADLLRGPFKPHEYGLVILPMTVVKRFHDCLLPTHQAVLDTYEKVKKLAVADGFLRRASGYQFYNTSKYTFDRLLADPENIESNFRDYLNGFSANVQDVLAKFDFENIIKRMVDSNTLYLVIKEFGSQKGYLGPDKISAVDCGYIFEDLVRRFSESFGEEAGAHFTSRDIIYLMTDLLLSSADLHRQENVTVYDMTMGTSQMLSCMEERIHEINPDMEVTCFGQEFNPSTFAIAKADMMIRGGNPDNMRFGDTLSDDKFTGYTFRYIISNPPFGIDWKREQKAVEAEAASTDLGFSKIPEIIDGGALEADGEVVGGIRSANEAAGLRGGVSRYLESTPDHPGLLALRALAELHCKDYSVSAIRDDFEAACNFAITRYSSDRKTLTSFVSYFMRKIIERDPSLFAALVDGTSSFIDRDDLCAMLIDNPVLTEEQKMAPAIVFFSDMARKIMRSIKKVKGA